MQMKVYACLSARAAEKIPNKYYFSSPNALQTIIKMCAYTRTHYAKEFDVYVICMLQNPSEIEFYKVEYTDSH